MIKIGVVWFNTGNYLEIEIMQHFKPPMYLWLNGNEMSQVSQQMTSHRGEPGPFDPYFVTEIVVQWNPDNSNLEGK